MSLTSTRNGHRSNSFELPYGYQIDLDFIKYCEGITKPILTDTGIAKRHQRRQRHSIEVMLGLEKSFNSTIEDLKQMDVFRESAPTPPPRSHARLMNLHQPNFNSAVYLDQSDLEDAVNDFEKTFENSHYQKNQQILSVSDGGECLAIFSSYYDDNFKNDHLKIFLRKKCVFFILSFFIIYVSTVSVFSLKNCSILFIFLFCDGKQHINIFFLSLKLTLNV